MTDDTPECDLGPWRDPIGDDDDEIDAPGDGSRRFIGQSLSARVNRWLAMPDHYDLRGYLASRNPATTISIDQPPESAATPITTPPTTKETP